VRPDLFKRESKEAYRAYARRYCGGYEDAHGCFDDTGATNLEELYVLCQGFMIRRLKKGRYEPYSPESNPILNRRLKNDVLKQLPSKIRQEMSVEPNQAMMPKIGALLEQLEALESSLQSTEDGNSASIEAKAMAVRSEAYAATGKAKLEGTIAVMNDLLDGGSKLLLFAHHSAVLDGLASALHKKKVRMSYG